MGVIHCRQLFIWLILIVLSLSWTSGLKNKTVTVEELREYKKQHCRLSTGFDKQFLCTYIIVNGTQNTLDKQCMIEAFYRDAYSTIILIKFWDLIQQNVVEKPYQLNCNTYILLIQEMYLMPILFSHVNGHSRFYPFTNIMIVFDLESKSLESFQFDQGIFRYISKNSLNVVWIHYADLIEHPDDIEVNRVLSGEVVHLEAKKVDRRRRSGWTQPTKIFDEDKLINTLIDNKHGLMNLTVSLFKCPPFIYYITEGNTARFDGVEYRFLNETAKNWGRKYILRDFDKTDPFDPYDRTVQDIQENLSNMTMCSIWMTEENHKKLELSRGYDTQCATFVVPIQSPLTQASLIYLTLDWKVWSVLVATFIVSTILLKLLSYVGEKIIHSGYRSQYQSSCVSALEMVNIVTNHGVAKFPYLLPLRVLIFSWTFFSLLIGTGYSTGYVSLLTIPRLSKPIDMLSDFLDQKIGWGEPFKHPKVLTLLYNTENPQYIQLAKRMTVEDSYETIYKKLEQGNYGRYTKTLADNFVMEAESYMHLSKSLRVMTQCIFKYFSVFGFEKLSPFRKIFDRQIPRFVESGILNQWFKELILLYSDNNMQYFFDKALNQKVPVRPLRVENILGALYLLAFGLLVSTIAFCLEIIVHAKKMKNMQALIILSAGRTKKSQRIKLLWKRLHTRYQLSKLD